MADEQAKSTEGPAAAPLATGTGNVTTEQGASNTYASASASFPADGSKPDWLPEDVEWPEGGLQGEALDTAMKKHFTDQEAAAGKADAPKPGEEPAKKADEPKPGEEKAKAEEPAKPKTDDEIRADLKKAGGVFADPKYEPFALSFEKNGDLTAEERAAAATAMGYPPEVVNQFVDLQKANRVLQAQNAGLQTSENARIAEGQKQELFGVTEGAENYGKFAEWAAKGGLTAEQQKAYEEAPHGTAKELLSVYYAKFKQAGGGDGGRDLTTEGQQAIGGKGGGQGGAKPYASREEQLADQRDERYDRDPAFRSMVMARIQAGG